MLIKQKFPEEQLSTLRNTVANQDIQKVDEKRDELEWAKRAERREKINRPKRSVKFNLGLNQTKEFKKDEIIQCEAASDVKPNNEPVLLGRLVKFADSEENIDKKQVQNDESDQQPVEEIDEVSAVVTLQEKQNEQLQSETSKVEDDTKPSEDKSGKISPSSVEHDDQ